MKKTKPIMISKQAMSRLPEYLHYLKGKKEAGMQYIAAPAIAADLHLNDVQVRKDLAKISSIAGKPKAGFLLDQLIRDMESFLGYDNLNQAVLAGVGSLGKALLSYQGFSEYGLEIVAGFDQKEAILEEQIGGKKILPMEKMQSLIRRMQIKIGIIAAPKEAAQEICDAMVQAGVLAIWNFAPVYLAVPQGILLQNENMALSLATLSKHLKEKMQQE